MTDPVQPSPSPLPEPSGENIKTGPEHEWTRRLAISTAVLAFFTFVVAAASVYQSCILSGQLGEMHQASDIERRMLELSQRAYIFFYETSLNPSQGVNVLTKFIENSGNTATKHLQASVKCITVEGREPEGDPFDLFKWDSLDMSQNILAARQRKDIKPADPESCDLTPDAIAKIGSGAIRRYVAGEVIYYESVHPTCRRITQFAEEIVIKNGIMFARPRGQHNCADEDFPGEHKCESQ